MTRPAAFDRALRWAREADASAVRNSLSMATPLAIGTALGAPAIGGLAAIGAFTTMYTHNKPYRQRVKQWLFIAGALLASFVAGALVASSSWAGVVVIGVSAVVLTYLMRIVAMGPPGAYILVLACATGTHLPPDIGALGQRALAVAAGSVVALIVCTAGWWTSPDNPERLAIAGAMRKVAAYLMAGDDATERRHRAQRSLHEAAVMLTNGSDRGNPGRLAEVLRQLRHLTDSFDPAAPGPHVIAEMRCAARFLNTSADDLRGVWPLRRERTDQSYGHAEGIGLVEELAVSLRRPHSSFPTLLPFPGPFAIWRARTPRALRSAARAGFAATAAGCVAIALAVDRPYWGAAAAIAVLANDGTRATFSRAWARFAGTIAGVGVAAGIIATHPEPAVIVIVVALLQFTIQLVVGYSYGLAVVAITPLALLLADAASGSTSLTDLLPRLLETAIGCALGLAARLVIFPNSSAKQLPVIMARVAQRTEQWEQISSDPAAKSSAETARPVRVALERALLAMEDAINAAKDEIHPHPNTTNNIELATATLDRTWPTVTLTPRPRQ